MCVAHPDSSHPVSILLCPVYVRPLHPPVFFTSRRVESGGSESKRVGPFIRRRAVLARRDGFHGRGFERRESACGTGRRGCTTVQGEWNGSREVLRESGSALLRSASAEETVHRCIIIREEGSRSLDRARDDIAGALLETWKLDPPARTASWARRSRASRVSRCGVPLNAMITVFQLPPPGKDRAW